MLAGVKGDVRTGVERRPVTDDIVARGEVPESIDGYVVAVVLKYTGRGVSTESGGRGSPSGRRLR